MQLFICSFDLIWNNLLISEQRVFHQLKNVLRANISYEFEIQNLCEMWKMKGESIVRYRVKIIEFQKDKIMCEILEKQDKQIDPQNFWIIVSMLNKFDKIELIVQKLSEIWIPNIVFAPTNRSVVKEEISQNKLERLKLISLEAIEQSKWWILPEIIFTKDLKKIVSDKNLIAFDFDGKSVQEIDYWKLSIDNLYAIIWPEWWFSDKDYELFWDKIVEKINLWETVLRAETWSIISAWIMKNLFK